MTTTSELLFHLWRATGRYDDPKSLSRFDARVYSQNGEDGVIAEIFRRIGAKDRYFIEIGAEQGLQNNTRLLLEQGWRGLWVDGSHESIARARQTFAAFVKTGHLDLVEAQLTIENINSILDSAAAPDQFDFLSLDVDQNTSHLWRAMRHRSRVACIEYNASLPPSVASEAPYDPQAVWDGTNWFGASLKSLELIGRLKNMALVGCEINGVNAFFVDAAEADESFLAPFTAERHFEPPRYDLAAAGRGHPPSRMARKWVE